jgi:hypothetical protein
MAAVIRETSTADHDADVVVFLIGMRINRWRSVRHWLPVVLAFLPMIRELLADPNSGCRSVRTFFSGRTILTVQYWDSVEQVIAYARDPKAKHRPAWQAFNRSAGKTAAVGIFHETYSVRSGDYETIYRAMPAFGLAAATNSVAPVARRGITARDRLAGPDWQLRTAAENGCPVPVGPGTAGPAAGCPMAAGPVPVGSDATGSMTAGSEAIGPDRNWPLAAAVPAGNRRLTATGRR